MKIAAAQISCLLGDLDTNLNKIERFAAEASQAGSEVIVFPEMVDTGYGMATIRQQAAPWADGAVPRLREIARRHSIALICGVSERDGAAIYNSQVALSREGNIVAKYRKTHLFPAPPIEEPLCFTACDRLISYAIGQFRFGLTICYDLRFPELYRKLAIDQAVNVFIISSAWPFPRVEHFRALAVARAIENQSYVIAANRVGTDDGLTFCGTSAIIDPAGVTLAVASTDREELLRAELSQDAIGAVRERMAVFADRRLDLYS